MRLTFKLVIAVTVMMATVAGAADRKLTITGSIRVRGEAWDWFQTPGYDDQYTFGASLIRVGVAQQFDRFDWNAEIAQPTLAGLPDHAVAPAPQGQLGLGASYFAANGDTSPMGLFVKQAAVRFKITPADSLRIGRFEFSDGGEMAPKNAALVPIKNARVNQRLIGPFGFSHVGRSFDGLHYSHQTPTWNATALVVRPTAGAFRVHGGSELDVNLAYASFTRDIKGADARLFAIGYQDRRDVLKVDNRPLAARQADLENIEVATIGGHYLRMIGNTDVLLWGAYQSGSWGGLDHDANAFDVEAGYHFPGAKKATLRGGYFRSSGDDNPADGKHGTFFQVLPTPRIYARFPFYNAMNSEDAFVQFSLKPTAKLTVSSELHQLGVDSGRDLWYAGGGAFDGNVFGFAGRPANRHTDLARVIDLSLEYAFNPKTTLVFYGASASGGDIISTIYPAGDRANYAYIEFTRRF